MSLRSSLLLLCLLTALGVQGCGSAGPSPAAGSTSDRTVVDVRVADGRVQTADPRVVVTLNTTVSLAITGDVAGGVHVHGVDAEWEVPAGQPVTHDFVANIPGIFEVEMHGDVGLLFSLEVRP